MINNHTLNIQSLTKFKCHDLCDDNLLYNKDIAIFYTCITYTKYNRALFKKKFNHFRNKYTIFKFKTFNLYSSEKYLSKLFFKLSEAGKMLLNNERALLGWVYAGIHIRTYGHFDDFKENPIDVRKKFNVTLYLVSISNFYRRIDVKNVYLSSDSIIFKNMVNNKSKEVNLHYKNVYTNHSKNFKSQIDEFTFLDIEILSNSKSSLLTKQSTFSLLIYMKNENCKKKNCIFV